MPANHQALEFLGTIERAEEALLTWGVVDSFFSEAELEQRAEEFLEELAGRGVASGYDTAWDLVQALLDDQCLWRLPNTERYRSRMAETVRLLARLRQIFPDPQNAAWRTAPGLVADYRLLVRRRMVPRRDVASSDVIASVRRDVASLSNLQESALRALIRAGTPEERSLARFQVRSIGRVLRGSDSERSLGTVVCAGTGSGKTLAFYLPAYTAMAAQLSGEYWTKCLALYPRNELLKDQLREALGNARRVAPALAANGKRAFLIAALYGDVPNSARALLEPGEAGSPWRRLSLPTGVAYECPFVRCPRCSAAMAWPQVDAQRGVERLVCTESHCIECVGADEICLTRQRMLAEPPDILFTSTEMLNQRLSSRRYARLFGIGQRAERRPGFVLLDEVHAYEGIHGAHVALLIRRWRRVSGARPHFVGLSATLADAPQFFAELTGLGAGDVSEISPEDSEMRAEGAEYQLALRGDAASGTSLLSTSIQTLMLLRRVLAPGRSEGAYGSRVFAFTDNLDVINRLFHNLLDAEGWDSFGRPNPGRVGGSLANLRARTLPNARERLDAGQNWSLVEEIGHALAPGARVRIGRTSSQDAGVDANADIVVATAALEVGFDDPDVGAVLQHKAPQSAAAFLQRKGRSGRRQTMRPWTVVVLSDYGRDRSAYQAYDQLFAPQLPPRHLPLGNRAVLRMQATYALLDWLARRIPASQSPEPWGDLSQPPSEMQNAYAAQVRARQELYAEALRALLEQEQVREELSTFIARSLFIDEDEVTALLWEPPRAVMTEAVPTLLRRIERGWRRAMTEGPRLEYHVPWAPLPEFVPRSLFSDLQLPEVTIRVPGFGRSASHTESMPLAQALREFAPGRVSRRFGITHGRERHWIAPIDGIADVPIDSFCPSVDRQELGVFSYRDGNGSVVSVPVYRPHALNVVVTPSNIQQSSNSFLVWHAQIVPSGQGHEVEAPEPSHWNGILRTICFHTHNLGLPVEVRRFSTSAAASIGRGKQRQVECSLRFVHSGASDSNEPAALGFVADVDGVQVGVTLPDGLLEACSHEERLLRSLRVARFKDNVRFTPLLHGLANSFQREWLAQAYLSTVTTEALRVGNSLEEAEVAVFSRLSGTTIREVLDTILQTTSDGDSDSPGAGDNSTDDDDSIPRRLQEILDILAQPTAWEALHEAARALYEQPRADWEPWLRARFCSTLASAILRAAQNLCPQMDSGALVVDLGPETCVASAGAQSDLGEFWLTEATIGGGGLVEEFLTRYAEDPRRFFRLLDDALAPSDLEVVSSDLERLLEITTSNHPGDAPIAAAFVDCRAAQSHEESSRALHVLRREMAKRGICPTLTLLVTVNARLLRPGTNAQTDELLATVMRDWREAEGRLGIDIDARVLAFAQSSNARLERVLGLTPPGDTDQARAAWRYSVLYSMLWPRGAQVRSEAMRHQRSYSTLPECDRLLVLAAISRPVREVALTNGNWFAELSRIVVRDGSVELVCQASEAEQLAQALLRIGCEPIDSEALMIYARLIGIRRERTEIRAAIELPEAFQ